MVGQCSMRGEAVSCQGCCSEQVLEHCDRQNRPGWCSRSAWGRARASTALGLGHRFALRCSIQTLCIGHVMSMALLSQLMSRALSPAWHDTAWFSIWKLVATVGHWWAAVFALAAYTCLLLCRHHGTGVVCQWAERTLISTLCPLTSKSHR